MIQAYDPLSIARRIVADLRAKHPDLAETLAALDAQLDAQSAAVTKFISVIVHELRKPMTSIRGYTDMLAKGMAGALNPMQQNFADTVRSNVIRMDWLLADLSDLNKLIYKRIKIEPKSTVAAEVLAEVESNIAPLVAEYEHTLTVECEPNLPEFQADTKQIIKMLTLMGRNAVFYTPKSTGKITLSAKKVDNSVRFAIQDNGIGMKPEDIARLGEPFFRADHELVTNTKGYGVGVAVVKGFLWLMESALVVESAPDKGSTFSFSLPLPAEPTVQAVVTQPSVPVEAAPTQPTSAAPQTSPTTATPTTTATSAVQPNTSEQRPS